MGVVRRKIAPAGRTSIATRRLEIRGHVGRRRCARLGIAIGRHCAFRPSLWGTGGALAPIGRHERRLLCLVFARRMVKHPCLGRCRNTSAIPRHDTRSLARAVHRRLLHRSGRPPCGRREDVRERAGDAQRRGRGQGELGMHASCGDLSFRHNSSKGIGRRCRTRRRRLRGGAQGGQQHRGRLGEPGLHEPGAGRGVVMRVLACARSVVAFGTPLPCSRPGRRELLLLGGTLERHRRHRRHRCERDGEHLRQKTPCRARRRRDGPVVVSWARVAVASQGRRSIGVRASAWRPLLSGGANLSVCGRGGAGSGCRADRRRLHESRWCVPVGITECAAARRRARSACTYFGKICTSARGVGHSSPRWRRK